MLPHIQCMLKISMMECANYFTNYKCTTTINVYRHSFWTSQQLKVHLKHASTMNFRIKDAQVLITTY